MVNALIFTGVFAVGLFFTVNGAVWLISPGTYVEVSRKYLGGLLDAEWGRKMTVPSARLGAGLFILLGLFFMYEASTPLLSLLRSHAR